MTKEEKRSTEEESAIRYVHNLKNFINHLITYLIVIIFLSVINILSSADYYWVVWPALGWGIGVLLHALNVFGIFNFFSPDWEKRQIKKRLSRQSTIKYTRN